MEKNNMICDLETGVCGVSDEKGMELIDLNLPKEKIDLYYITDPICSHCWALEPVMGRFKAEYGDYMNAHTIMGGLLEDWKGFADASNGISSPSDVASHWREVGEHSRMPIDGSLWLNNPVHSSYPPSRVFKVIQQTNEELALAFLRKAREAVFAFNQNIGEDQVLIEIVNQLGLQGKEIVNEANLPKSQQLLEQDFDFARKLGVRGFPTIIMVNKENKGIKIVGARSFESYVDGLKQILTEKEDLQPASKPELSKLLVNNARLFSREIEEIYELKRTEIHSFIQENLSPSDYVVKEVLGEVYIENKIVELDSEMN